MIYLIFGIEEDWRKNEWFWNKCETDAQNQHLLNGFGTNMKLVQFCFVVLYNFWAYIQSAADGTDDN